MTDTELLAQRYIDQDLAPDERLAFLSRLVHDAAFRERVLALEHLALAATRLPRPAVSGTFVSAVLDRAVPAPALWERFVPAARGPLTRVAAVLAVLLVGAGAFTAGRLSGTASSNSPG